MGGHVVYKLATGVGVPLASRESVQVLLLPCSAQAGRRPGGSGALRELAEARLPVPWLVE